MISLGNLPVWVYVEDKQSRSASPWSQSTIYDGDIDSSLCQRSIDTLMVSGLLKFHQVGDLVSLKEIGLSRAVILGFLALLFFLSAITNTKIIYLSLVLLSIF